MESESNISAHAVNLL